MKTSLQSTFKHNIKNRNNAIKNLQDLLKEALYIVLLQKSKTYHLVHKKPTHH